MKKIKIALLFCLMSASFFAQEFTPIKTPDVASFMNANYLPINESTGKTDVTIPIYTIDFDGLSIPISISYDTGGVKVNSAASTIGLNWTLNAGGLISKEVQGYEDTKTKNVTNDISTTGRLFVQYGYLYGLVKHPAENSPIVAAYKDTEPDLYFVFAPGLTTKFIHKPTGEPLEISKSLSIIQSPFQNVYPGITNEVLSKRFKFKITPNSGFIYTFDEREYNYSFPTNRFQSNSSYPITANLTSTIWPANYTEAQLLSANPYLPYGEQPLFPTIHLSSITNPVTKGTVKFYYDDNFIVDNDRRIERTISNSQVNSQVNFEHDFSKQKLLRKISFPDGIVDFYYDANRTDVRGGKILKKIEVRNNYGELIKGVVFEQDYFTSVDNCTENNCYRLRLNAIKFLDKTNAVLPGYSFVYNATKLPRRFSIDQDFMGYFNGLSGIAPTLYFPKSYFKAGQGKKSVIPFPFTGYTLMSGGNVNKTPNLAFGKAASLEKIIYPNSGYSLFEFESHDFDFNGSSVLSGGLRLKTQTLYDWDNVIEKKIGYDYRETTGISSGSLLNFPLFSTGNDVDNAYSFAASKQVSNTELELTNGSHITYKKVKSSELNNGYIINEYTSNKDFPNFTPTTYTLNGSTTTAPTWLTDNVSKGYIPTLYQDFSEKRGRLLSSSSYNNSNILLQKVINEYEYSTYGTLLIDSYVITSRPNLAYNIGASTGFAKFTITQPSENNHLKKTITTNYATNGSTIQELSYVYDATRPLVKEVQQKIDNSEIIKDLMYYPFDTEVSANANMDKLRTLNKLMPVKKKTYKNTTLLNVDLTEYGDFGANKILPNKESEAKGSAALIPTMNFLKYDKRGNIMEYRIENGMTVAVLWGYAYRHKIAEILNATYAEVLAVLARSDIEYLQTMTNVQLEPILTSLRTNLPNAQMYSYVYNPAIGLSSMMDARGLKSTYTYDSFKRLLNVKDYNNFIVTENTYNYKLKPTAVLPAQLPLSVNIAKENTLDYLPTSAPANQITLLKAMVTGGKGDYAYEWRLNGSTTILNTAYSFAISVPCNNSATYNVKVTDTNGTALTQTVIVKAPNCGDSFFVGTIEGSSTTNNQHNYLINAEGGSYGVFSYLWYIPGNTSGVTAPLVYTNVYPQSSGMLVNTTSSPKTVTLAVKVTDEETGYFIVRTRSIVIPAGTTIPTCFIAGTEITMSDGSLKKIEEVTVGDTILTFNLKNKKIEIGHVDETVTPVHDQFVTLKFENGISNTNTLDHPYFVKGKGWCSYDPKMTKQNYDIDVQMLELADVMLEYQPKNKTITEIILTDIQLSTKEQKTYNLSKVGKNHSFFANGILVHNKFKGDE